MLSQRRYVGPRASIVGEEDGPLGVSLLQSIGRGAAVVERGCDARVGGDGAGLAQVRVAVQELRWQGRARVSCGGALSSRRAENGLLRHLIDYGPVREPQPMGGRGRDGGKLRTS